MCWKQILLISMLALYILYTHLFYLEVFFPKNNKQKETYLADWQNPHKKCDKKVLDLLKEDKESSISKWADRQEYLAKKTCDDSKFCPCFRNEEIV